jgi:hypothetical protein
VGDRGSANGVTREIALDPVGDFRSTLATFLNGCVRTLVPESYNVALVRSFQHEERYRHENNQHFQQSRDG